MIESAITELDWTTFVIAGVALCLATYVFKQWKFYQHFPPGPRGFPLYGNSLDLKKWDAKGPGIFDKWGEEYGDIYSVTLGAYPAIVLNSLEVIKEVLVKQADKTSGRFTNIFFYKYILRVANYGVSINEGQPWKDTRRTMLHSLRDFGMGKKSLEHRIQEEARAIVGHLDHIGDKPLDPRHALHNAFSNVIVSIAFGERYDYDDSEFCQLSDWLSTLFVGGGFKNPELFSPILFPLFFTNRGLTVAWNADTALRKAVKKKIKEHKDNFSPDEINSFIDIYLKAEHDGEFQDNKDSEKNLFLTILDLFFAGSETSTTTMRWAILYLIHNPDVQAKCQHIIKQELGEEKVVSGADRINMPYIEATVYETLRLASTVPYSLLHRVEDTLEVSGYTIPKDTLIMSNLYRIHMNPQNWKDPEKFNPDRWIGPDGKLVKHEAFVPFGIGPRECLGQALAQLEIFIILVSLLQKFTFKPIDPENLPKLEGEVGIMYIPHPYQIRLDRL